MQHKKTWAYTGAHLTRVVDDGVAGRTHEAIKVTAPQPLLGQRQHVRAQTCSRSLQARHVESRSNSAWQLSMLCTPQVLEAAEGGCIHVMPGPSTFSVTTEPSSAIG